jgi:hypothetical protein
MHLLSTQIVSFREIHVLHQLRGIVLYEINWSLLHLENYDMPEVFLSKSESSLTGKQCAWTPASHTMVFFQAMHVFLQLRWIGLFGTKGAYLQLENYARQEVFLSKPNSGLKAKQWARRCNLQHTWFLCRGTWIFSTHLNRPMLCKRSLSAPWDT